MQVSFMGCCFSSCPQIFAQIFFNDELRCWGVRQTNPLLPVVLAVVFITAIQGILEQPSKSAPSKASEGVDSIWSFAVVLHCKLTTHYAKKVIRDSGAQPSQNITIDTKVRTHCRLLIALGASCFPLSHVFAGLAQRKKTQHQTSGDGIGDRGP